MFFLNVMCEIWIIEMRLGFFFNEGICDRDIS